uniref:Uncharacterized protein n=1 Tax=Arundo donax TaxID=35708 RepID=A0A0A9B096_ARUDO
MVCSPIKVGVCCSLMGALFSISHFLICPLLRALDISPICSCLLLFLLSNSCIVRIGCICLPFFTCC